MSVFDNTPENRCRPRVQGRHRWGFPLPSAGAHFFVQCDLIMMPETAEELSRQPDVRKELVRTTGQKGSEKVRAAAKDKFWFVRTVC